ncbi:VOC family protein [Comamonas resistens]|uniref:VOC family protein n=1 Tax=Comamonas resistens TaxID=3046670 RepID=A0ABY8SVP6_9BURK|nr:VOC family protein [Comamonas resistens]MDL5035412.1 VOC family protein [Comamonas resistens]WHS66530.1 VOC family protein [Comamonas resistens]
MSGPAAAGVLIYAKHRDALANFYGSVLGMQQLYRDEHLTVIASPQLQLVVHAIPEAIASQVGIASPPARRENVALKFFATVPSIAEAARAAEVLGGQVFDERWQGAGFAVCNAMDCEGNVFQLREWTAVQE